MASLSIVAGATSQSTNVFLQDVTSPLGAGLTGLVFNTTGLTCYYTFTGTGTGSTQVTLATLAAVNSAYSSGGFKEIDATNMPGWYRFDIPNAALGSGNGREVNLHFQGAQNAGGQVVLIPCPLKINLTGWDDQNAVTGGMSANNISSSIKKNTPRAKFAYLMTDSVTHTPKTGLSVTCTRAIDGGAFGSGALANVAELSNGIYLVDFGASDLNGSIVTLRATAAGADDTFVTLMPQP